MASGLPTLAKLYGVQARYAATDGSPRTAPRESVLAALQALGAPLNGPADVDSALRERQLEIWRRPLEPVVVVWDGDAAAAELRLPAARERASVTCVIALEGGQEQSWKQRLADAPTTATESICSERFVAKRLALPENLPQGYHHLNVSVGKVSARSLLIVAPRTAFPAPRRAWGIFAPLYALHSAESWGVGDMSDLRRFGRWVSDYGGSHLATLPLLASFLDEPFEPSPYLPVSRLFWNELFVDVEAVPELQNCRPARDLVASAGFQDELVALRSGRLVDYRRTMKLKRRIFELLATSLHASRSDRQERFDRHAREHPQLDSYASFRAAVECSGRAWPEWSAAARAGELRPADYDQQTKTYHAYVQWLSEEQLDAASRGLAERGVGLHLDFPLGTNPAGYDTWHERDLFAHGISTGAPPDAFQPEGQDWGFPPINPRRQREQEYRYYIAAVRNHLRHASSLRIDHVMGLHRLFVIPKEASPSDGVYVRSLHEELYAVLTLESQRAGASLLGEDLGTVPRAVRAAMRKHGMLRSHIVELEAPETARVPRDAVAALNTHDLPPFAGFWALADIDERERLGALTQRSAAKGRRDRRRFVRSHTDALRRHKRIGPGNASAGAALRASHQELGESRASTLLVTLEDLWQETASQNIPGTSGEHPNWRRKVRYPIEELSSVRGVAEQLKEINQARRESAS